MDIDNIVKLLRDPIDYKKICIDENNFLHKCILCKKFLKATEWSSIIEKYLKNLFMISNTKERDEGDGITKNNKKVEIKVSLGDTKGQFNFVQLRPDHKLDYYLIVCYNLYELKKGKIYFFLCEPTELYKLIPKYGGYAHGNTKILGNIKKNNIKNRNLEYNLHPIVKNNKNKQNQLWNEMIKKFLVNENQVNIAFGNI